tara:strand:+ start:2487 stop:2678 length:192 start_codon:yes stop_codon:yes gene_type:complete
MMQRLDLVKFLAESAAELLDTGSSTEVDRVARLNEAAELLALSSRLLARTNAVSGSEVMQEAA